MLQDSRLLRVEALALDSLEEGLVVLVFLLVATHVEILGAGFVQSYQATLALLSGGTVIRL